MTVIRLRRGTAAAAASNNPVLLSGEPGYETDTGVVKVGNGSTAWTSLPTLATIDDITTAVNGLIAGAPGALDTLNELAAAINDDASYAATITTALAAKEPTITAGTTAQYWRGDKTWQALPYDVSVVAAGAGTLRAVGYNDFPFGVKLQRACTLTSVTFRANTADGSGNLVVELRKNGSAVAGTSTSIAAASQVAGGTSTGSWSFAAGDILSVYVTAVGTAPGTGLIADAKGVIA
jgi:hypothetical protein